MMKIINNLKKIGVLIPLVMVFFTVSCGDDDAPTQSFDIAQLQSRIAEAENLIATGVEGINAGDYQPGSKDALQDVVNWIYKRIESSKSQADIDDAVIKLNAAIDKFLVSVVSEAFPWIQHGVGSSIEFSANVKQAMYQPSTLEMEIYIVDLNQAGYSNNLISTEDEPSRGMTARYFGTGEIELVAGTTEGWPVSPRSPAGTLKSGEWMNVAYTNSGTEQNLYINGQLVATLAGVPEVTDVPWVLGNSPTFTDRSCNTLFKEVKVWNSVFDQSTIQSNIGATVDGTESGLVAYFPFSSNLGTSFSDVVGNSTATLKGNFEWVAEPPIIVLDYTNLNAAIQELTDFRATVVEGDMDGDYPVGTLDYIDSLLEGANDVLANETRQTALDDTADALGDAITLINANLVGPADGVYVDSQDPSAVGLRITPNYTPQGDYTYEFYVKLQTLNLTTNPPIGDIMGNGTVGFRVNGYAELTEENVLNSGGGWNWTAIEGVGYIGPMYPAGTMKSGTWQHVAIVHDNTALTTAIYVDGEMVGESTDIGAPQVSGWGEIWLGNSFGFKMNGSIKDFRIWDEVRSPAQLGADIDGSEPNLQIYFPLDRVKGIQFADETGDYSGEMRGIVWNN
ncbi:LamG domain-containing protein [Seonamhaeicola sediminis]|uniref:LamG domain-containing protein n=1 Tax=Seonamhaeicola sediminis TaxID=2528206 RepID=A0A562YJ20_9FLAO|nr:LamG-like jellyroll fold domain-containing protein [Seonamhaeicola sediminis]TWO34689.1 LamG domain-containing protein [Seonamhaeicola sediminis]